jgi:hypothetical protein
MTLKGQEFPVSCINDFLKSKNIIQKIAGIGWKDAVHPPINNLAILPDIW